MPFYDCFIAMNNFAFNLTAIKELIEEGIRGITPGDWAKCIEHALRVERVYILVKGDCGRERSGPMVIDIASGYFLAPGA